ncbi:hypothetical protein [Microbispora sp. NBRC 16548]|uniref:hypothetical protein n=1 Tax=Microbispora sp. NBRC 16548 TaxID=3030994 RepID=UPI0024A0321F|nr:hypothetical protein [Microbispora sp. NBRC 16548]GLX06663.1 hypothetical protein Misp03_35900 [Microbispora sp. NBRC 16548]
MDIGHLIDLVLDGPRTPEDHQAIGDWLDARHEQREAIRAELLANPGLMPYELLDGTERQFRPGYSPAPVVPVKRVGIDGARVGQVQQDNAGRWVGYYLADAPGEYSVARGQQEPRETVEEAVADVLTEYVLRR